MIVFILFPDCDDIKFFISLRAFTLLPTKPLPFVFPGS